MLNLPIALGLLIFIFYALNKILQPRHTRLVRRGHHHPLAHYPVATPKGRTCRDKSGD
jgi:hypothetical protein